METQHGRVLNRAIQNSKLRWPRPTRRHTSTLFLVQRLATYMWHPVILTLFVSLVCEKAAAVVPKCKFNTIQGDWKLWDTCYLEISGKKRYKARDGSYYLQHEDGTYVWTEDGTTEPACYEG